MANSELLAIGCWEGLHSCPDESEEQEDQEKAACCCLGAIQQVFLRRYVLSITQTDVIRNAFIWF